MSLLEARGLAVGRAGRPVLVDIDLAVLPGEFVGLIGPNGAGKSTLLATLSGSLAALAGGIWLQERELSSFRPAERARILTHLPQDPGGDDAFTVAQLVDLGRTPHRGVFAFGPSQGDRVACRRALERAGAASWRDRRLGTLSGGQRQRARIAMALAQEPAVLLADEPTTALDLAGQLDLMRLLTELAGAGLGILAVLHDLNLASQFCSRLVLVAKGRVLADGAPGVVLTEKTLAEAYGIQVQVAYHPQTGAPFLLRRVEPSATGGEGTFPLAEASEYL